NSTLHLEHSWHTTLHINPTPERSIRIDIPIENTTYTIELEPHSVRSDTYALFMQDDAGELYEVPAGPIRTLRGTIVGMEGSVVAGSLMEDGLHARIRFSDGLEYWMEPVGFKIDRAPENLYAFYRNEDIIPSGGICAAEDRVDVGKILSMQANFVANQQSRTVGGTICTAELGVDADYEYYQDWGSQTESQINSVINSVNVQYENSVNLTHAISSIIVRSSPNDPYTSTDAETLLNQFRSEWQSNQGGIAHDIAHLFTGKSM
ncbi:MAG: M12 family metallo-peptidase, partial [Phycisphaerales bacterium]